MPGNKVVLLHFKTGMFVLVIKTLFAKQSQFYLVTEHVANSIDYHLIHRVSAPRYKASPWHIVETGHESLPLNIKD